MASVGTGAGFLGLVAGILQKFPGLAAGGFSVTSAATPRYNCIAWAAEKTDKNWWPNPDGFWPPGIPYEQSLGAFEAAFRTLGYQRCEDDSLQHNLGKIAIYISILGLPTHAARQLPNGRWTSKLGPNVDIEHANPAALRGQDYGSPALIMARQIRRVL